MYLFHVANLNKKYSIQFQKRIKKYRIHYIYLKKKKKLLKIHLLLLLNVNVASLKFHSTNNVKKKLKCVYANSIYSENNETLTLT